jgi:hypothetical protein
MAPFGFVRETLLSEWPRDAAEFGVKAGGDFFGSGHTDSVVDLGARDLLIATLTDSPKWLILAGRVVGDELLDLARGLPEDFVNERLFRQ